MVKPNYKVHVYDHQGRFIEKIPVKAKTGPNAVEKAKAEFTKRSKKDTTYYTFCASGIQEKLGA